MAKLALLVSGCCLLAWMAPVLPGQGVDMDSAQGIVTSIAPDLAIVTEISLDTPYLGQQFCIIYRLRAQRPPAAVDIDPQQYPGFWTEAVPLSAGAASAPRPVKDQNAVDYLLRQVIAYPLLEGNQQLPPLSIKVKRAGTASLRQDDWDVRGTSAAVKVRISPLPPGPALTSGIPFVGGLQAAWAPSDTNPDEVFLEIQGTANLAFFQPGAWFQPPAGMQMRERLVGSDKLAQTVDIGGRRQLSFLQRQRWLIRLSGNASGRRIEGFYLPVFEPYENSWKSIRVEGVSLSGLAPGQIKTGASGGSRAAGRAAPVRRALPPAVLIAVILGLCAGVSVFIAWQHRRKLNSGPGTTSAIAALEKKLRTSPRAFVDGAHKALLRCAADMQRSHTLGLGDSELDRCWITVQRYRFNKEPLSRETCAEIMQTIRNIIRAAGRIDGPSEPPPLP